MGTKENKELIRQLMKEWNEVKGDIVKTRSLYQKYYAASFIYHDVSGEDMNREEAIKNSTTGAPAFPDLNYAIEDIIAEGDKTVAIFTMQATHQGTYMGIPATGKQITVKGVEINRIADGKIVETWDFMDSLGMMNQLGAIPSIASNK